jgi:5'-3' exonuclease
VDRAVKVYLVDGTFELFRAFYGAPSATSPDGREVGASISFFRSMLGLVDGGATHVAIAFDHVIESFRNRLFDAYKTGDGMEPALADQFELVERIGSALGFVTWPMIEHEADDAIATFAARAAADPRVEQVVICSPDKDLAQCVVTDRVVLWDRVRKVIIDEAKVVEKFGVAPAAIPHLLALVGDDADGVPGLPRWGMKSASTLLARYGTIDAIPDDPSHWSVKVRGAANLGAVLAEHRDRLSLYRRLTTLVDDVPLAESVDDLEWKGADRGQVEALALELGSASLVARVPRFARPVA